MHFCTKPTLAALLAFMVPSIAQAETLNAQQVKALTVGKTVSWVTPDGQTKGYTRYKANGTAMTTVTAPNAFKDSGTWRLEGNQLCSTWQIIRDGREGCSTVRTTSKQGVFRTDTVFLRSQ